MWHSVQNVPDFVMGRSQSLQFRTKWTNVSIKTGTTIMELALADATACKCVRTQWRRADERVRTGSEA